MATIRKLPSGSWQAMVRRKGDKMLSKTFLIKAQAEKWARQVETQLDNKVFVDTTAANNILFSEIIDRFGKEITPRKKGHIQEGYRLHYLETQFGHRTIADIQPKDIAKHRDNRLSQGISGGTVVHELNLLHRIFDVALRDWGIYLPENPVAKIRKPKKSNERNRRLEPNELEDILLALQTTPEIRDIVLIAKETGLRRSEILSLTWDSVDLEKRIAYLATTKNGSAREIPLSSSSIGIFKSLNSSEQTGPIFRLQPSSVSRGFNRACKRAGIKDLRFHDLRHEATSRFFEIGLNTMEVASITGHKTLSCLKRYTHLRATDLAQKLG